MNEITLTRDGAVDTVVVTGERDMSNVEALDEAVRSVLSDESTSCLLDLSGVTFMDSTVVHALVRWSKEAQVSEREALAIVVGSPDTPAARVLEVVGLLKRLPVFATRQAAKLALEHGRQPRTTRPLGWLTDLELLTEREDAQAHADAANDRLRGAIEEQDSRRNDADRAPDI
jgi:anti-anti-sigma factor